LKKSMIDILACPVDKHYPLELFELDVLAQDNQIDEAIINEGLLFCNECLRYYPIIDEIPIMLPDELRERQTDINFLQKWKNKIPDKVIRHGNPWHIDY
jgi:uncharacterized protein YbaR (Trm112 family)